MTQTAKHTLGPWQDNDAGLIYGQVSGDDDEAPFVCDVCACPPDYTAQEKANSALITAAPEMLDALQQAVQALNTVPRFQVPHLSSDSYRIASICTRAIAMAKGGAA